MDTLKLLSLLVDTLGPISELGIRRQVKPFYDQSGQLSGYQFTEALDIVTDKVRGSIVSQGTDLDSQMTENFTLHPGTSPEEIEGFTEGKVHDSEAAHLAHLILSRGFNITSIGLLPNTHPDMADLTVGMQLVTPDGTRSDFTTSPNGVNHLLSILNGVMVPLGNRQYEYDFITSQGVSALFIKYDNCPKCGTDSLGIHDPVTGMCEACFDPSSTTK